jgi:hypothetical protein
MIAIPIPFVFLPILFGKSSRFSDHGNVGDHGDPFPSVFLCVLCGKGFAFDQRTSAEICGE